MLDADDFATRIVPYLAGAGFIAEQPSEEHRAIIAQAAPLVQERVQLLGEVPGMLGFLFVSEVDYAEDALKGLPANAAEVLAASVRALEGVDDFTAAAVQEALSTALVEELGLKPRVAYGPPRVALTGRRISPPLFESMELLGKAESIRRLEALVSHLAETPPRSPWPSGRGDRAFSGARRRPTQRMRRGSVSEAPSSARLATSHPGRARDAPSEAPVWRRAPRHVSLILGTSYGSKPLGYGVIGNTAVSGSVVLGSSPGTPAL